MAGENQSGMQCVEVEALLAEALDGTLQGSQLAAFEAHQRGCASCRSVVEEARAGMHWLKGLDEAEPPRNLVHNILAQTIGALPSEHAVPVRTEQRGLGQQAEGAPGSDLCSGGHAAFCHVVRYGVLFHHHAAGHRRLPHERLAPSGT